MAGGGSEQDEARPEQPGAEQPPPRGAKLLSIGVGHADNNGGRSRVAARQKAQDGGLPLLNVIAISVPQVHDRVGDELQLVAEAPHAPRTTLFSGRRDSCHTRTPHSARELLSFVVLAEPSASRSDERAGCSAAAFTFHHRNTDL